MSCLIFEDFRRYPAVADLFTAAGRNGPYRSPLGPTAAQTSLVDLPSWRAGVTDRCLSASFQYDVVAKVREFAIEAVPEVCFSFIAGAKDWPQTNFAFTIFGEQHVQTSFNSNILNGIRIRSSSTALSVEYAIATSTSSVPNTQIIAELPPLGGGLYHVEGKINHSDQIATIVIYVNGLKVLDATYDRDRINSGMQDLGFRHFAMANLTNVTGNAVAIFRDIMIYTNDAKTAFPLGPLEFLTINPTTGAGYDGLKMGPVTVDDGTYLSMAPGTSTSGTFDNLPAGAELLGLDVQMRHKASNGLLPSDIQVEIKKSDSTIVRSIQSSVAAGASISSRRNSVDVDDADVDGLTFTIRSGA